LRGKHGAGGGEARTTMAAIAIRCLREIAMGVPYRPSSRAMSVAACQAYDSVFR
jgi:hypothetical protein